MPVQPVNFFAIAPSMNSPWEDIDMTSSALALSRKGHRFFMGTSLAVIALVLTAIGAARQQDEPPSVAVGGLQVLRKDGTHALHCFSTAEDGTILAFCNAKAVPELNMQIKPNGDRHILLADSAKLRTISISLTADGQARVYLSGGPTQPGASLGIDRDGGTFLRFYDSKQKTRIALGLRPDGSPGLEFFDENQKGTSPLGGQTKRGHS
jgi:hypothetical protein